MNTNTTKHAFGTGIFTKFIKKGDENWEALKMIKTKYFKHGESNDFIT